MLLVYQKLTTRAREPSMPRKEIRSPVAERARQRLAVLEAERVLAIRVAVPKGRMTEQEAKERGP